MFISSHQSAETDHHLTTPPEPDQPEPDQPEPDQPEPAAFWGEPIYTYTRAQAIEDGVLVDATFGDLAPVTRQHFPGASVAMTIGLFSLIQRAVDNPKYWNDWRGVWHDICFLSKVLPDRDVESDTVLTRWFRVIIVGAGRKRYQSLKRVITPSEDGQGVEITFMLADED